MIGDDDAPRGATTAADPLGRVLHVLRLRGTFYCRSELTAPWGLALPTTPGSMWFHVVTGGGCWLEVDGEDATWLDAGDVALVTRGQGHRLRSAPGTSTPPVVELPHDWDGDRYTLLRHGGGGAPTSLVCGAVAFGHPAGRTLIELMPPLLRVTPRDPVESTWIDSTVQLMALEARALRPGGEAVTTRLADVLVVAAVRAWIAAPSRPRHGWLAALQDPDVGRAITAIHHDPARAWTVAELATQASMSRSSFAARFTALVGEPAMAYVTRWRMQVAQALLDEGGHTIAALAARLGYGSEAAFSRAFKRVVGVPPGAARGDGIAHPLGGLATGLR